MTKKMLVIAIMTAITGISAGNFAAASEVHNVAIVDVAQVVEASTLVKNLKQDQEAKAKELLNYIEKARKDVAATTDVKKKQALEDKYTKEILNKKEAQKKNYLNKLKEIDQTISGKINQAAKAGNYDLVLTKNSVLYGGTDITEDVKKLVK